MVNLPENETRLGSSGARGDNANINLRSMGATATLVLVKGHRMVINPMTAGLSQAVNVNQLPTQGVERIDVTDTITAFAEFGYYMADSTMQRQPLALNGPTSDKLMLMPVDNPYGSRFYHVTGAPNADGTPRLTGTPRTVGFTQMTLAGLAPEVIETDSDVLRFTAGLKGELGETWTWSIAPRNSKTCARPSAARTRRVLAWTPPTTTSCCTRRVPMSPGIAMSPAPSPS